MWDLPRHTYEEVREVVIDVILHPISENITKTASNGWPNLIISVGYVFSQREKRVDLRLHPNDAELVRDVFWDLFRQGFITLGKDDPNNMWPWFRLSHFGQKTLQIQSPYRFHDTTLLSRS